MRKRMRALQIWAALIPGLLLTTIVHAHGFVGARFFPPTITTDDPFAVDELALPTVTFFSTPTADGEPESRTFGVGFEFDKEIFPHFSLGIADEYSTQSGHGGASTHGWGNIELAAKYQIWQSDIHEMIVSIGLSAEIGHSGNVDTGDSFSTLEPTIYLGKGFGDLPESLSLLKPVGVTATLSQSFPTSAEESNNFEYGFAIEYSIPYLQSQVRNLGLPQPFRDLIPLTEFSFSTAENRADRGTTTGTVNPGLLWETQHFQLGAEALIPINHDSGAHVGATVQMWIYIDDLLPQLFGHPLFGASRE